MDSRTSRSTAFGTFPGADGIPPGVCVPDPVNGEFVAPFHDSSDLNDRARSGVFNAVADIDGGRIGGFVGRAEQELGSRTTFSSPPSIPVLSGPRQATGPGFVVPTGQLFTGS